MYDPTIGRWISQDPIGFAAGDANLYRYVGNRPASLLDPTGLAPEFFEDYVGLALLGWWVTRGTRFVTMGPIAIAVNAAQNDLWKVTGVPVFGLSYAVISNKHVQKDVKKYTKQIQGMLAVQPVGDYAGKGSTPLYMHPESTYMQWILSKSVLKYSYKASVQLDKNGNKCAKGFIEWEFYDQIDANDLVQLYKDGKLPKELPLIEKFWALAEGFFDLAFDKMAFADYDLNVWWITSLGGP
jgi:hypothetical protein